MTADLEMNAAIRRLALAFGIDHILLDRNRPTDPARSDAPMSTTDFGASIASRLRIVISASS